MQKVAAGLFQSHEGCYGHSDVAVAGCLSAPRAAINPDFGVCDAYNRVVVIQQSAAFDMLQPQMAVCAFAGAALAQKHVASSVVDHDRCMNQQGVPARCCQHVAEHHGTVKGLVPLFEASFKHCLGSMKGRMCMHHSLACAGLEQVEAI